MKRAYRLRLFGLTFTSLLFALTLLGGFVIHRATQGFLHPAKIAPYDAGVPHSEVQLTTSDGVTLSAWYTPPQNGAVILLAHGLSGNRSAAPYALLVSHGYGVMAWDFRAHGLSGGDFSTLGDFEQRDVTAALDYVLAQPNVKRVGAWGGSMGASTLILSAAKDSRIEALVSDSAFPTLEEAMRINMPDSLSPAMLFWWQASSGARLSRVRPVDEIEKISPRAVFIIDGWAGAAQLMNAPHRLYDAAQEPKQIWVETGVPHLGMSSHFADEYARRILAFFDLYLIEK